MAPRAAPPLCTDGTGYVTLMTSHSTSIGPSTFMARNGTFGASLAARHAKQVQLLVALLRSLRRVELCRRDFIVLLGTQVPLSPVHRAALTQEGMLIHPAPPIIPGVPTADKLLVWKLTRYKQLAVIDADVMFLRPIDALFGGDAEFTIAHHPYDHLQAQCEVPVSSRGIAALFVVRPNPATYEALMRYLRRRFRADQLLYSDQTGLMCYFGNRSRTLPCPYVYDVSMTHREWLPKWTRNCRIFVKQHVLRNCLPDLAHRCRPFARRSVCDETQMHVTQACAWPAVAADVHAVHFKGTGKPWASATHRSCRPLRSGRLGVRPLEGSVEQTALETTDQIEWNASWVIPGAARSGACISQQWQLPVYWARTKDGPIHGRKCCNAYTVMAAYWNELLPAS